MKEINLKLKVLDSSDFEEAKELIGEEVYRNRQENAAIFSRCDELAKFYTN